MPTTEHEFLTELSLNRPEFIGELLRDTFGPAAVPAGVPQVCTGDVTATTPVELRADQVIVFSDGSASASDGSEGEVERTGPANAALIVEVQRERDPEKLFSWPSYVVLARAQHRCPTSLLVVCTKADVARWAARPIVINAEGCELRARVIGPQNTPYVNEPATARASPELAVLSSVVHGDEEDHYRDIIRAMLAGLRPTATGTGKLAERHRNYLTATEASLPKEAREFMMSIMAESGYIGVFDRYRLEGKAEGKAEGEAEGEARGEARGKAKGEAESVLKVLTTRGVDVPDEVRDRVLGCTDLDVLDRLLERALTVITAKDLFD